MEDIQVSFIGQHKTCRIPVLDYLDMIAMQNGFDDYQDLLDSGYQFEDWTKEKYQALL